MTEFVLSVVVATALAGSAALKLTHSAAVVAAYARTGVPERRLDTLAAVLLALAAGLLVGLAWDPAGLVAPAAVSVYFAVACAFHVRHRDIAHIGPPLALLVLSAVLLALRAG